MKDGLYYCSKCRFLKMISSSPECTCGDSDAEWILSKRQPSIMIDKAEQVTPPPHPKQGDANNGGELAEKKFINQTILHDPDNGKTGNCLAACVATILEIPLSDVPEFENMDSSWWHVMIEFPAKFFKKRLVYHPGDTPPKGWSIGTVNSPRFPDQAHAVVCFNGDVVHDPHPSKASMNPEKIWYYETFENLKTIKELTAKLEPLERENREAVEFIKAIGDDLSEYKGNRVALIYGRKIQDFISKHEGKDNG